MRERKKVFPKYLLLQENMCNVLKTHVIQLLFAQLSNLLNVYLCSGTGIY